MRKIQRSTLLSAIGQLTAGDPQFDQLEIDLFHLLDDREVRPQRRTLERFIEADIPSNIDDPAVLLHRLQPTEYIAPAIVDPYLYVDNDWRDEAPPEAFKQLIGYRGADGEFVPFPELSPLPRYCRSTEAAGRFKWDAFGALLYLRWREVPSEWDTLHHVSLVDDAGGVVAEFTSDMPATAIVGAVLSAMSSGWTHPLIGFEVVAD